VRSGKIPIAIIDNGGGGRFYLGLVGGWFDGPYGGDPVAGRSLIVAGSVLLASAGALLASGWANDDRLAVFHKLAPQTLHVGQVRDAVVTRSLPLVNRNPIAVRGTDIIPTCGCTKVSGGRFDLQPGERREIPLAFRAKSDQGLNRLVPILVSYRIGGHAVSELVTEDAREESDR